MKYEDIRPELDTFDVVLFQGSGWFSRLIGLFCKKWSHVGLVIKTDKEFYIPVKYRMLSLPINCTQTLVCNETNPFAREDVLMIFESAIIDKVNGVQLNLLSDRIKSYKGKVFIRRFIYNRTEKDRGTFSRFISKYLETPYERDILELLGGAIKIGKNQEDLKDFFCSELAAESFQDVGFLPQIPPSNKYSPYDFANGAVSKNLIKGKFGEPVEIKK